MFQKKKKSLVIFPKKIFYKKKWNPMKRAALLQEYYKSVSDRYLLKMLIRRRAHFGFHRKFVKKEFKPFLHCFFNDHGIINLKKTIFQLRTATHLLYNIALNHGKIVIVDSSFVTFRDLEKLITLKEIKFLKRSRWIPGMLSNQKNVKNAMTNYVSKRFAKKDKKYFFESMIDNLGNIDLLIITDPLASEELMNEASIAGVPVIAFVDLNGSLRNIDYPIICNNQTRQSIFFLLQILHTAYKKGHEKYLIRFKNQFDSATILSEKIDDSYNMIKQNLQKKKTRKKKNAKKN